MSIRRFPPTARAGRSTATASTSCASRRGQFQPVDGFWSVTAYDKDGYFIPNALQRQALGDRDKLVTNPDGSLDLLIQAESAGKDKEANWLPVAKAPFNLLLRLYSPRAEILNGSWTPPSVKRVDGTSPVTQPAR